MTIQLFKNLSPSEEVNKSLEPIGETIPLKWLTSEEVTQITFECRQFDDWQNVNYVYIDEFNRFYAVTSVSHDNHPLITFNCAVDVIMSFREELLNSIQIVTRSKNKHNVYYVDSDINLIGKNLVQCKRFTGSEINSGAMRESSVNIVLTVAQK